MIQINITMPEDCNSCPFNYDQQECCASFELNPPIFFDRFRRKMFGDEFDGEGRHPRCPLKPLYFQHMYPDLSQKCYVDTDNVKSEMGVGGIHMNLAEDKNDEN